MTRTLRSVGILSASFLLLPFAGGCGGGEGQEQGPTSPSVSAQPGPNPGGAAPAGKSSPEIKQIMTKLAKGPNSLTPVLGKELKDEPPAWETIQGQTKEYAQLAGDLAKYDPPKGSKESWIKLTGAYATAATDLDKASQAKDKDAAMAAHETLANSCMTCHREHRVMGPGGGMGGPGGGMMGRPGPPGPGGPGGLPPGGPGRPGGGPPPGGPGGPPSGGEPPK